MRPAAQRLLLAAVAGLTVVGFATLYRLRLTQGDVFPAYSSLRADPLGTRALYEGLDALPGLRVSRRFQPLDQLDAATPRTIVVAGLTSGQWGTLNTREFGALDTAVRNGSRLVVALRADFAAQGEGKGEPRPEAKAEPAKPAPRPLRSLDAKAGPAGPQVADLRRLWGVGLSKRILFGNEKGATLAPGAPAALPRKLRWNSGLSFAIEKGADWRVVYSDLNQPVLLERSLGRGSIVLAGDAYFLSNEALLNDRATRLLTWMIGPNVRVVFDEGHLGVVEDVGMAALARRYGLAGALGTLGLVALLFVWKRMALFVPPQEEAPDILLDCSHTAALEELLRRSVRPGELIAACAAEWGRGAPPLAAERMRAALAAHASEPACDAYNAALRALRRK